jgi:hypothetical protein
MGFAIYIDCPGKGKESWPVAGRSAIDELWTPIVQAKGLDLLEVALSAGLTVDDQYYEPLIEQLRTLLATLPQLETASKSVPDTVRRCEALLGVLEQYPPSRGCEVYLG